MTAHALKGDLQRCLDGGMDRYISKPIRTNELFATIESLLSEVKKEDEEMPESSTAASLLSC